MNTKKLLLAIALLCAGMQVGVTLHSATNPHTVYSTALYAARPEDDIFKNFLASAWYFLPEVTPQQEREKQNLAVRFFNKFGKWPTEVQVVMPSYQRLAQLCPPNDAYLKDQLASLQSYLAACEGKISGYEACEDQKKLLGDRIVDLEQKVANSELERKQMESVQSGLERIAQASMAFNSNEQLLRTAYRVFQEARSGKNPDISREDAVRALYNQLIKSCESAAELNRAFHNANIATRISPADAFTVISTLKTPEYKSIITEMLKERNPDQDPKTYEEIADTLIPKGDIRKSSCFAFDSV
jgi:hypothetical protein